MKAKECLLSFMQSILSSSLLLKKCEYQGMQKRNFACHFYGHVSWFLTLGVKRRLRMFENGVLRKIFGPKWDEVTGEWRRLYTEEFMICTS